MGIYLVVNKLMADKTKHFYLIAKNSCMNKFYTVSSESSIAVAMYIQITWGLNELLTVEPAKLLNDLYMYASV